MGLAVGTAGPPAPGTCNAGRGLNHNLEDFRPSHSQAQCETIDAHCCLEPPRVRVIFTQQKITNTVHNKNFTKEASLLKHRETGNALRSSWLRGGAWA